MGITAFSGEKRENVFSGFAETALTCTGLPQVVPCFIRLTMSHVEWGIHLKGGRYAPLYWQDLLHGVGVSALGTPDISRHPIMWLPALRAASANQSATYLRDGHQTNSALGRCPPVVTDGLL